MNWEGIDLYAFETLGQVRRVPLTATEKAAGDGRQYDHASAPTAAPTDGAQNERT